MAADFNAGSIEATLNLNIRPFLAGLQHAKAAAQNFAHNQITVNVGLDDKELQAKSAKDKAELEKLDHKKVSAKADLDIGSALAKAEILNKALDAGGLGKNSTSRLFSAGKIMGIVGSLLALTAAAIPAAGALTAVGAAGGVAFAGIGASIGLFAAVAISDFTQIKKAAKAGLQLKGPAGEAETAMKGVEGAWKRLKSATASSVFGVMTTTFRGLTGLLPRLVPLINTTARGIQGIVRQVFALTHTAAFSGFLRDLQSFMHGFLAGVGPVLTNFMRAFMAAFHQLQPVMALLGRGILQLSSAVAHFATGGGLKRFVDYAMSVLPQVLHLIGNAFHVIHSVIQGLMPLANPALSFLNSLLRAVARLNLAPLARGFGNFLRALAPILHVGITIINVVLQPLGRFLTALANGPVRKITHALGQELHGALGSIKSILNDLVKPVADFVGSIANLANPTGIHLVSTLLHSLAAVVHILAPAVGRLAVALEGVIDRGIEMMIPAIKPLTKLLIIAAHGVALFANWLAKIIAHKAVVVILLSIYGAMKLIAIGSAVARAATAAWTAVQWLLNAALTANPIGLVIVAIGLLVAGIVIAWNHSKTFRKIVTEALNGIKVAAVAVAHAFVAAWQWVVKVANDIAHWFTNYWVNQYRSAANTVKSIMNDIKNVAITVARAFVTAWNWVITEFNKVKNWASNVAHWFASYWVSQYRLAFAVLKSIWNALGSALQFTYQHVIKPVFDFFQKAIKATSDAFHAGAQAIKAAWGQIVQAAEVPVRFVVNTVLDKGIIGSLNTLGGFFKLPKIPPVRLPFGTGGPIPGSSPHDTADNVNIRATAGEFMVRRPAARKLEAQHPGALAHMNATGELPRYGIGGWIKGAFQWGKNLVESANPVSLIKKAIGSAEGALNGMGSFGRLAKGAVEHVLSSAMTWLTNKIGMMMGPGGAANLGGHVANVGSGVKRWSSVVLQALSMLHQPASLLGIVLQRMQRESSGNPNIVNHWDSNARAGHPSGGLMQVIGPTFAAYGGPLRNRGLFNPLANVYAALNYSIHQYGSIMRAMTQPGGYAGGIHSAAPGWRWIGEFGPELMKIPGGSKILSHGRSVHMANNEASAPSGGSDLAALLSKIDSKLAALLGKTPGATELAAALGQLSHAQLKTLIQVARAQ